MIPLNDTLGQGIYEKSGKLIEGFQRDGYLVIPQLLKPKALSNIREEVECLVGRQRKVWKEMRRDGDPLEGWWEMSSQPRIDGLKICDSGSAQIIEIVADSNAYIVSQMLLSAPLISLVGSLGISLLCNPIKDHTSPWRGSNDAWHRDFAPALQGPLGGFIYNNKVYGIDVAQWNIALYDDNLFHLVPGSHTRFNTKKENEVLAINKRGKMPNQRKIELRAGDGIVYSNLILHRASTYTSKLRRTLNFAYRGLRGPNLSRGLDCGLPDSTHFVDGISLKASKTYQSWIELLYMEQEQILRVFNAILQRDKQAFWTALNFLNPADSGKLTGLILLSKTLIKLKRLLLTRTGILCRQRKASEYYLGDPWSNSRLAGLLSKLTIEDISKLLSCFKKLDLALRANDQNYNFRIYDTTFQDTNNPYHGNTLSRSYSVNQFMEDLSRMENK